MGIASATRNQLFVVSIYAVSTVWNAQALRNFQHAVEEDRNVLQQMATDHEAILAAGFAMTNILGWDVDPSALE